MGGWGEGERERKREGEAEKEKEGERQCGKKKLLSYQMFIPSSENPLWPLQGEMGVAFTLQPHKTFCSDGATSSWRRVSERTLSQNQTKQNGNTLFLIC